MLKRTLAGCAALLVSSGAWAFGPGFQVDGYFASDTQEAEVDSPYGSASASEDGTGIGVRGIFKAPAGFFGAGEYTSLDYDGYSWTDTRFGGGYEVNLTPLATAYGQVDWVSLGDDNDTQDGFAGYVGGEVGVLKMLAVHGRIGYLSLSDYSGPELTVGGSWSLMPMLRVFAEYRWQELTWDEDAYGDATYTTDGFRLGARFSFNS